MSLPYTPATLSYMDAVGIAHSDELNVTPEARAEFKAAMLLLCAVNAERDSDTGISEDNHWRQRALSEIDKQDSHPAWALYWICNTGLPDAVVIELFFKIFGGDASAIFGGTHDNLDQ